MNLGRPIQRFAPFRLGVVEIPPTAEPWDRNWTTAQALFRADREALRRWDYHACSALEMAESMDRFLRMGQHG